ncbi:uncharacterized protein il17rc isoform X2 [Ctenopharyngodon idella]|uniref:uncharacterized protein il17rc isoform X2 n=1 Tax=Ctenopharyngodon idella TaxID=7959 RepID=UPI0022300AD0|nr:uncharacterized protein il17rc isoform X2 [Ctenopharyngodon idella]
MELTWWRFQLLLLASACVCSLERVEHNPENNIICPQSLSNCSLRHTEPLGAHGVDCGRTYVCRLEVTPKLCCHGNDCKPCLWSNILLSINPEEEEDSDIEGPEYEDENSGERDLRCVSMANNTSEDQRKELCEDIQQVAITICYISEVRHQERCRRLDFTMTSAASHEPLNLILVEYEDVDFGRKMVITVRSSSQLSVVDIPTLKQVCSLPHLKDIKQCKGPRISIKRLEGVVKILVANEDKGSSEPPSLCMKRGREGRCWPLANNSIPLESITDCMCFQVWTEDSPRSEYCPFENNKTEFNANVLRNMSVSVAHIKTNNDQPAMSWNLTVPCRISAELWPCQLEADGQCREIKGFRQHGNDWEENSTILWASGKFVNIASRDHQQLCVKLKVDGKIVLYCQHPLERQYWSLLVLLPVILVCLTIFGVLLLVNKLKSSRSKWDRCHSQGTQDMKGQVLLLHSSATDPQLVCKLGLLLSELGYRVFLDLWNQTELGSLGPAAWLHSKLDHIQKHGGKALLLLSPSTLQSAECYWNIAVERQGNLATYSSDTLASALTCIFADRQKGGTAQRFILVQLDCHELLIKEELPVLLRGLPRYKLPSQSQGLLMELCLESPNNVCGKLKKMWWIKRARRKLAKGVQNISIRTRVRTETMLTQSDSLSLDTEDTEERVFLEIEQY